MLRPNHKGDTLAGDWQEIAPSDDDELPLGLCNGIYVGGSGDIVALSDTGNTATFIAVPAGSVLPVRAV